MVPRPNPTDHIHYDKQREKSEPGTSDQLECLVFLLLIGTLAGSEDQLLYEPRRGITQGGGEVTALGDDLQGNPFLPGTEPAPLCLTLVLRVRAYVDGDTELRHGLEHELGDNPDVQ